MSGVELHARRSAMSLGHRFFIIDGKSVVRLPQKTFNEFFFRERPVLRDRAGTALVIAMVIYELKNRKPAQVVRIDTNRVRVNLEGAIDKDHFDEGIRVALARGFDRDTTSFSVGASNVVDAKQLFDERRWRQHHPEIPGPALKNILADLFGGAPAI